MPTPGKKPNQLTAAIHRPVIEQNDSMAGGKENAQERSIASQLDATPAGSVQRGNYY